MTTYKLFKTRNGKLYPLYVEADREMETKKVLKSHVGELVDDTHVKAKGCGGKLALRAGFHSTLTPFTDWIGKRDADGTLIQRKDTVWCECEVDGKEIIVTDRRGLRNVPNNSYYRYKTNNKQKEPWIISDNIKINRVLTNKEVADICKLKGVTPQKVEV